jgi:putative ABC transport system permease protein
MLAVIGMALGNLVRGGRRNLLLGLALGSATMLLVLVTALFTGVSERLSTFGLALHSGDVNVLGWQRDAVGRFSPVVSEAGSVLQALGEALPEAEIVPRVVGNARLIGSNGTVAISVNGIEPARESRLYAVLRANGLSSTEGSWLPDDGIALFEQHAQQVGAKLGDRVTLWGVTDRGANNTVELRVSAIARDIPALGRWSVFAPADRIRQLFQRPASAVSMLMVYRGREATAGPLLPRVVQGLSASGAAVEPYRPSSVRALWRAARGESSRGSRLAVNALSDQLQAVTWRETAAGGITLVLFIVLSAIVAIGLTNAMLVAIKQRTREIGTLRALGMSRKRILALFLLEGGLLGGAASLLGATAGAGASWLLNAAEIRVASTAFRNVYLTDLVGFSLDATVLARVCLVFAATSALASLWPAWRAARLSPVLALRHVT